jgi:dipeptidase D
MTELIPPRKETFFEQLPLVDREPQIKEVWKHFFNLCAIYRPSFGENEAGDYVKDVASKESNLGIQQDAQGNILIRRPAKPGFQNKSPILFQAHLDAAYTEDHPKGVGVSPLWNQEKGVVEAQNTILTADNGLGCGVALTLMARPDENTGEEFYLFTVAEEEGLQGVQKVKFEELKRVKYLINLDANRENNIYVGCPGSDNLKLKTFFLSREPVRDIPSFELTVDGLRGGHSGHVIDDQTRPNAIKLLAYILETLPDIRLRSINGGGKWNIIPSSARAEFSASPEIEQKMVQLIQTEKNKWPEEKELRIEFEPKGSILMSVFTVESSQKTLALIRQFPHGMLDADTRTSINLAGIDIFTESVLCVKTKIRSNNERDQLRIREQIQKMFDDIIPESSYLPWKPAKKNKLRDIIQNAHRYLWNEDMIPVVAKGGIEPTVLIHTFPNIVGAIGMGANIDKEHEKGENAEVLSVSKFLITLLESINLIH